MDNRFFID